MSTVRARFAPSPTGNLHLGTLRTALFTWLYARHHGGTTVLRIEDTDLNRSNPEFEGSINEGLEWLGLGFDESPQAAGAFEPYRQSERISNGTYQKVADELVAAGKAYPCFCTAADLDAERDAATAAGKPYVYSQRCRQLSVDDVAAKKSAEIPHTIRFHLPESGTAVLNDLIRGEVKFEWDLLSDFVIMKSDGSPSYNFACVVDDADMDITHVIRGEDHISNTPRQMAVYEALGKPQPAFAHLPMILGQDKSKLSKRHGATNVMDYQIQGFLPEALFNYMTLLGWSPQGEQEILSKEEIVAQFDLDRVSKSGAVFDLTKLTWMNGQYIRALSVDDFESAVTPFISADNQATLQDRYDATQRQDILSLLQDTLEVLTDINDQIALFTQSDADYQAARQEQSFSDRDKSVVAQFIQAIQGTSDWGPDVVKTLFDQVLSETGLGKGAVFKPLRKAATGAGSGPDIARVLAYLGKDRLVSRLSELA